MDRWKNKWKYGEREGEKKWESYPKTHMEEEQRVREEREDGGRKALKLYFLKHEAGDLGSIAFYCKGCFAEEKRKCFTIVWHCRLS